ncbi:uncharacterized protein RCC_01762 [Ramularia collo-cygni]|uniref:Uncharacterized protein n=1 Tax=Ramularia collo-cygni TaxID=112498 RepID=A0A2D3V6I1_9PEZI|nr:uncharacterized protein RCC_01762 [Ramularia collo-cygni]CZT15923.1 uncharacterized protein RCC_01762 [Ramularia collo-cygni]
MDRDPVHNDDASNQPSVGYDDALKHLNAGPGPDWSGNYPDTEDETDEFGAKLAAYEKKRLALETTGSESRNKRRPKTPPSPRQVAWDEAVTRHWADKRGEEAEEKTREEQAEGKGREKPLRDRLERKPEGSKPREPFWRAKERHADRTVAKESDATRPKQHVRAVSDGYPPADPPVNVPQGWGHRNRHRASWLHRSTTEGEALGLIHSVKRVDEDTVLLHKTSFTGDDILAAGQDSPMSARRLRQFSSPSSLHHMNTTIPSAEQDVDDLEFNDDSVLVSTPAVNTRNRKIDELMKGETVDVERHGVTTQRQSRFALSSATDDRPVSAPEGENRPFPRRRRGAKDKEEAVIDENVGGPTPLLNVTSKKEGSQENGRNDSIDLLRRLARASSLSPTPASDKVVREYPDTKKVIEEKQKTKEDDWDASDIPTLRQRGRDKRTAVDNIFANVPAKPDNNSQKTRAVFSKLAERDPRRINSEPLQPKSALDAIVQEAKAKHDSNIGDSTMASLEDIVNPNTDNSSINLDTDKKITVEDTIEKGEAVSSSEETRRREVREFEEANKRLRVARTSIKDADRGLRRLENQLEATETEPTKTRPEAKKGTDTEATKVSPGINKSNKASNTGNVQIRYADHLREFTPYTDHNGRTRCKHCGGCYLSVWRGMWVEFRELFYTWGPEEDGAPLKMTWLGTMFAIWWAWIIAEIAMSTLFNPWLYDARFPFVTITLIYRIVREPLETAEWVIDVVGNLVFGDSAEVVEPLTSTAGAWIRNSTPTPIHERAVRGNDGDWVAAAAAATGAATRMVVRSAMDAVDEAGSMWDDDYLNL